MSAAHHDIESIPERSKTFHQHFDDVFRIFWDIFIENMSKFAAKISDAKRLLHFIMRYSYERKKIAIKMAKTMNP